MIDENQMIHPDTSGDDGDTALDAALAAADKDMLAAISSGLDLDVGLARILKDLGGSSAAHPGIQAQAPADPGKDQGRPDTATSRDPSRGTDAAASIHVPVLIRDAVEAVCAELAAAGQPVTFREVAARTQISRITLYRRADLRAVVEEHRARDHDATTLSVLTVQIDQLCRSLGAVAAKVRPERDRREPRQ
jgi:hypothetical protein